MKNNSSITKYLDYYISLENPPEFSVLIQGGWGVGKTYFIEKYIESVSEEQKIIKISLFGISSVEQIYDEIYQSLHPVLSSKPVKIATGLIKSGLKLGLNYKFDLNNDGNNDGEVSFDIKRMLELFEVGKSESNNSGLVFAFDDLERSNLNGDLIFGFINGLVEISKQKVILISNEEELSFKHKGYYEFKEKVIGKTLFLQHDFDSAFENFIGKMEERDVLKSNMKTIESIYKKAGYFNLRHIKQIIIDFQHIHQNLDERYKENEDFLSNLIHNYFSISIEIKKGKLTISELKDLDLKIKESQNQITSDELGKADLFRSITWNSIFNSTQWHQIFSLGLITPKLYKILDGSKYFYKTSLKPYLKLRYFYDMSDTELSDTIKQVVESLESRNRNRFGGLEYTDKEIIFITDTIIHLINIGLYEYEIEQVIKKSKLYINDLITPRASQENNGVIFKDTPENFNLIDGLYLLEGKNENIIDLFEYIEKRKSEQISDANLQLLYKEQSDQLLKKIADRNNKINKLDMLAPYGGFDTSFFSKMNSSTLLSTLLALKPDRVIETWEDLILSQYNKNSREVYYMKEQLEFWDGFLKEIENNNFKTKTDSFRFEKIIAENTKNIIIKNLNGKINNSVTHPRTELATGHCIHNYS